MIAETNAKLVCEKKTTFSVAANYDLEIVSELAFYSVDEVYGRLPADGIASGRPRYMATRMSQAHLQEYIISLRKNGIAFNYLLNGACFGNKEWSCKWQKKLRRLLEKLAKWGVTRVTVSTPFLLEMIKKQFPQFRIRVGIYAQVDTPLRARFWESIGADSITLESFSINRNLKRLTAIRQSVRCDLQLIVNHACLLNCPMQSYHQNGFAHASTEASTLFIDYCFLRCSQMRLSDPSEFIKAAWIRPEDIGAYESVGSGTFKILERGIPSAEILRRVKAYSTRRFEGNLAELVLSYGFSEPLTRERFWMIRHFLRPLQAKPWRMRQLHDVAEAQGMLSPLAEHQVRIDAAQIPSEFLSTIGSRDCSSDDCSQCGYCSKVAANAVTIRSGYRQQILTKYEELDQQMASGGIWYG